jgi:polyribonucleotide 5'-hydroxyl-kinase
MADRVTQTWEIKAECELRCEIRDGDTLTLRLVEGTAEIFGVEMAWHRDYSFINENFAIFTWYGCKVDATSSGKSQLYVSDETPMVSCVNTHAQLEVRRDVAVANQDVGPRVLIVGNQDSGKSTTARILAGYATRLDRTPIYIDLDVSEGIFGGIPGCIGAIPLDKSSLSIDEGFSSPNPLAFFFGHNTIKDNPKHYIHLVSTLARNVKARLALDQEAASSGLIINTNGQIDPVEKSLEVILHAVKVSLLFSFRRFSRPLFFLCFNRRVHIHLTLLCLVLSVYTLFLVITGVRR